MGLINVLRRIIHTLCAAGIVVAAGCATTPRKPAPISFDLALPSGLPAEVRTTGLDEADLLATYNEFMQHLYSTAPPRTLNILALSGGGAGGAFGAGALVGMTRRGDRPQFQIVTAPMLTAEMNFRLAGIPIDYPYGGPIDLDPVAMHALFEYGERCAEQGLLWTTPPEALHRRQAGLERYESRPNQEKPIAPKDVPCPAASTHVHPPI